VESARRTSPSEPARALAYQGAIPAQESRGRSSIAYLLSRTCRVTSAWPQPIALHAKPNACTVAGPPANFPFCGVTCAVHVCLTPSQGTDVKKNPVTLNRPTVCVSCPWMPEKSAAPVHVSDALARLDDRRSSHAKRGPALSSDAVDCYARRIMRKHAADDSH